MQSLDIGKLAVTCVLLIVVGALVYKGVLPAAYMVALMTWLAPSPIAAKEVSK